MAYKKLDWQRRFAERSDLSTYLTHLTKDGKVCGEDASSIDVLLQILRTKTITGSTKKVNGDRPVVCFQDAPPASLAQNLYYEERPCFLTPQ